MLEIKILLVSIVSIMPFISEVAEFFSANHRACIISVPMLEEKYTKVVCVHAIFINVLAVLKHHQ